MTTKNSHSSENRNMRGIIAAIGICAIGAAPIWAEEKPKNAPEPIAKLVENLNSRDYKAREAASRALEARGTDSLPSLRAAMQETTSAEVRNRLQSIVQNLERIQTLSPKRVTIKMINRPVAEVIREIGRQCGYSLQYQGAANRSVTIEAENATFWEVIDQVCNTAGLVPYQNDQGMVIYANEGTWPCVCYQGPFKIVANNFSYNKTMSFGPIQRNPAQNQLRNETLSFSFTLNAEPKLPLMGVGQPKLLEAVDELGNSMKIDSNVHEAGYASAYALNNVGYRNFQYGMSLNLRWPDKDARLVKRLRCSVPVTLLSEQKPDVAIDDVLKMKGKKFAGNSVEVQIDDVKELANKTQYHVKLSVRNTASGSAQDYTWTNSVHQRIELFDAKGNKYSPQGYNWENSSPNHVQATFMFCAPSGTAGAPWRLVYNHWVLMQHQIEFEFKNLELP
jgi:hypothetical protein